MMEQVLSPGVKDGEEADLGAEVFGVARDGEQCLGSGSEENGVNDLLVVKGDAGQVVKGDAGQFFGNGENEVEIFDR